MIWILWEFPNSSRNVFPNHSWNLIARYTPSPPPTSHPSGFERAMYESPYFLAQTRKNLRLAFWISFWIIKDLQYSINFALIFIKISFFKSKFAKISWEFSNFCSFPLIFRLIFKIFVSFGGGGGSKPPTYPYSQNYLNFSLNCLEIFDNFFQISIILPNFPKILIFSIIFNIFWKFSSLKKEIFLPSPMSKRPPSPIAPVSPLSAKSCRNYWITWIRNVSTIWLKKWYVKWISY